MDFLVRRGNRWHVLDCGVVCTLFFGGSCVSHVAHNTHQWLRLFPNGRSKSVGVRWYAGATEKGVLGGGMAGVSLPKSQSSVENRSTGSALEVEMKFDVPPNVGLPDFGRFGETGSIRFHDLNALYFDTAGLDLTAAGSSLRRRSGGSDAGWHLKLKHADPHVRREITAPIFGARPPEALRQELPESLAAAALVPLARLNSARMEIPLLDRHGREVAMFCVDDVVATAPSAEGIGMGGSDAEGLGVRWREVEIELASDTQMSQVDVPGIVRTLKDHGILPSPFNSKIERAFKALGVTAHQMSPLAKRAVDQVGLVQALEQGVARGEPLALEQCKGAIVGLKADLRALGGTVEPQFLEELSQELEWYEGVVSSALEGREGEATDLRAQVGSPRFEVLQDLLSKVVWDAMGYAREQESLQRPSQAEPLFVDEDLGGRQSGLHAAPDLHSLSLWGKR